MLVKIFSMKILSLKIVVSLFVSFSALFSNVTEMAKSETQSNSVQQIIALTDSCWIYRSSNPHLALEYGNMALQLAKENELPELTPKAYNVIGVVYRNIGKLDSSYISYKLALRIAEEKGDSIQIAYSFNNIGGYLRLMGAYSQSIDYMIKAMKIFENNDDKQGAAFCAINIGILFRRQHDFTKALQYLNRSLDIRKEVGDKHGLALGLNQIAEIHFETGRYTEALESYNYLLKLYEELKEEKGVSAVYSGIGGVNYELGNYFVALEYREKSIRIDRVIDNKYGIITNQNNMGKIFLALKNYDKAESNLSSALSLATETGFRDLEMDIYHNLANLNRLKGNFKKAYEYVIKQEALEDSLFSIGNNEKINELQTAYEIEKKDMENKNLKKSYELELTLRYLWLLIILLITFLVIVNWRRYKNHKQANKLLSELNVTKDKFFKILAHDLKNPFNTILGYSEILAEDFNEMQDVEKIRLIKEINSSSYKLHTLLENILKWADSQSGTLQGMPAKLIIKDIVDDVIHLFENVAHDKNLTVTNLIPAETKILADENMVQFIFRNLINNAIKYSSRDGQIEFGITDDENGRTTIYVKDSGIGIKKEDQGKIFKLEKFHTTSGTENEKGSGLGLILVKELVEKNEGKIWFESKENGGTVFYVSLQTSK